MISNNTAILTDTHGGARNDSDFFIEQQIKFYSEIFFPSLKKYAVDTIIHAGDLFNNRRSVNVKILEMVYKYYIKPIIEGGYDYYQLLGNHDIYYKTSRHPSSIKELFAKYISDKFHIIEDPTTVTIKGVKFFLCPWLLAEEEKNIGEIFDKTDAKICIGHFELSGFNFMRNVIASSGMDKNVLKQFDVVLSGHYHTPSQQSNVMYIGSPFQFTFADQDDRKKFVLFDPTNYKMKYIYNPIKLFHTIDYSDAIDIESFDFSQYHNTFVKLVIHEKGDVEKFEEFYQKLQKSNPFDLTTVDKYVFSDDAEDIDDVEKDTVTILMDTVDTMEIPDDRSNQIRGLLRELYNEATAG